MAIKPPNWCQGAVPSLRGWESPDGELLVARKHSQAEIDEYNGIPVMPQPKPVVEKSEPAAELLNEAPMNNLPLHEMTKSQLLALGEQFHIELKPSWTKGKILEQLNHVLNSL